MTFDEWCTTPEGWKYVNQTYQFSPKDRLTIGMNIWAISRREALEELLQYFEQKAAEARAGVRRAPTQADKDARMGEACWYEGVAYQVRKRIDAPVPTSRPQGGLTP